MKEKTSKRNPVTQRIQTIQNNLSKNGIKVSMPKIREWFAKQLIEQIYICKICNETLLDDKLNLNYDIMGLDHIQPISRGGSKRLDNCHLVHQECNKIKGDFSLEEIKYLMTAVNPQAWEILKNRLKRSNLIYGRKS